MPIEAARTDRPGSLPGSPRRPRWLHGARAAVASWLAIRLRLFHRAFDAAAGAQLIVGPDCRVRQGNSAFRRLFGATAMRSLRLEDLAAEPQSATRLLRVYEAAIAGRVAETVLPLHSPEDGASRYCRVSAGPIAGCRGYSLWQVAEVTALPGDEREAVIALLDAVALGWFSADDGGRFLTVNATLARWLDATPGELVDGSRLQDFVATTEPSAIPAFAADVAGSGTVALAGRKGTRFDASIEHHAVWAAGRRQVDAVVRNLSDEREAAARAPRDWFRRLFVQAPIGIALIDRSGRFVEANRAIGALFERSPQHLIGRDLAGLVGAADRARVEAMMAAHGDAARAPIEVTLDAPRERTLMLFLGRLEATHEADAAAALHCIDVTERKTLERQFAQSQKMQAIGQLVGGIAHDFNNLLTAMIGFCDLLLLRCRPGDPSFADIMQIQQNASRAANLVRQLLAFSRQQALQPRVLDITDILVELSHLLRRLIGENIELELAHGRDLGFIKVDQGQFEQVIINLVVNARDAMPGGGRLTIRTRRAVHAEPQRRGDETLPAGEYVLIEVADTGTGIPEADLEHIFEPFFSTKEVGSGTGLGLSTVYGIVRQTGGFVFVDSVPGNGSNFQIYLPCCPAPAPAPSSVRPDARDPAVARDLTGSGRVMLVEDDDPVRIFGARALRNKGYTVLEARSGEAALEQIRNGADDIDLLITDVVMPNMDGPQLVREMRELAPAIKVIFISGYAEDAFRQRLGSDSDIHFLPKPFTLKELAAKVREVLKTGRLGGGGRRPGPRIPAIARPR